MLSSWVGCCFGTLGGLLRDRPAGVKRESRNFVVRGRLCLAGRERIGALFHAANLGGVPSLVAAPAARARVYGVDQPVAAKVRSGLRMPVWVEFPRVSARAERLARASNGDR